MRILITGGAGFIGANLVKALLKKGHEVIALDNLITSDGGNLKELKKEKRFTFVKHDIGKTLPSKISGTKSTFQLIYHLACPTGVPNLVPLAEEMLLTSSEGTRNILELTRKHKAKLLFTSSSEVYGDPLVSPQTEDYTGNVDPRGIRSPYEEGKRFAESLIMMYVRKYKLNARIARVFNTYGPAMSSNETRVIPRLLQLALSGKPLTVHGKGNQIRTFCYVDDLVKGLQIIMTKGKAGEVYNLGNDKESTILSVAQQIIKLTGSKSQIKYTERPSHDHQRRQPSLRKVRSLGWNPVTTLSQGLKMTLASISNNPK